MKVQFIKIIIRLVSFFVYVGIEYFTTSIGFIISLFNGFLWILIFIPF